MSTGQLPGITAPDAAAADAQAARRQALLTRYASVRERYTPEQQRAISRLYETVRAMGDTGGGIRCAKFLLGLYNGTRFPFDLTDLRCLDSALYQAAMTVLHMDARHCYCEVHVLLEAIYADGRNVGAELEHWAHNLRLKNRCPKTFLAKDYGPKWRAAAAVEASA